MPQPESNINESTNHPKILSHLGALSNMVRRIAIAAGDITLKYYDEVDINVHDKSDGSPVTLADREAEIYIKKELADITPDVPLLGEESVAAGHIPDTANAEYFWCVDPLDGTKEFISGGDEFTVNIALIKNGVPVLGVVYVPVTGALYAGYENTAIKWNQDTDKQKNIQCRKPHEKGLTVISSKSHGSGEKLDTFLENFKIAKSAKRGSSLKICVIAEGKADIYPRFGPTCWWDTAAAHAVLNAAGGFVTDEHGHTLGYGKPTPKFLNPEFIASSFAWHDEEIS